MVILIRVNEDAIKFSLHLLIPIRVNEDAIKFRGGNPYSVWLSLLE